MYQKVRERLIQYAFEDPPADLRQHRQEELVRVLVCQTLDAH